MESGNDWNSYQQSGGASSGEFTRLTHLISSNIQKIQHNVSQTQRMVGELGTASDNEQLRGKLHETQHFANTLTKETNQLLKQLCALQHPPDQRQWKLQRDRLTNDLMVVLNNLQSAQRAAAQKEKASVKRAKENSLTGGTLLPPGGAQQQNFFDEDESSSSDLVPPHMELSAEKRIQIEQNVDVEAIREREMAIQQLESDIVDVNIIFKDLAVLVHDQGEIVDSIEANVESTVVHVESASGDIRKAADYQRGARKKKVILILFLGGLLIVLGLFLYFYFN